MNWLGRNISYFIKPIDTVLDFGCGIMDGSESLKCKVRLGIDIYKPYLEKIKNNECIIYGQLPYICENFLNKSWDVVLLLDILEHLHKFDAERLLKHADRIARRLIILWTPLGLVKQDAWDAYALGYNNYQKHVCGFTIQELEQKNYICTIHNNKGPEGECKSIFGVKVQSIAKR